MKNKFRELRVDAKLTQKDLATKLNITQSMISNLERGKRKVDDFILTAYVRFFNIDANYLLFDDLKREVAFNEDIGNTLTPEEQKAMLNLLAKLLNKK